MSHCLRDSFKHREPLSLQRKHINISNQTRVVRLYQQDLQSLVCTFVCGMSHTAQAPMIGQRKMHDWLYSQVGCTQNNPQISVEPLRISTTSCSSHSHSVTKGATCELGAFLPPPPPPTQFIPCLSLPERTSTTQRWNSSILAFQHKIKHGSKNKSEWDSWASLSSGNTVRSAERQTAGTVCAPALCLHEQKSTASKQALVLVSAARALIGTSWTDGRKICSVGPWKNKRVEA